MIEILICDDEQAARESLRQKIELFFAQKNTPIRIQCCGLGEEALALSATFRPPDILFLDIQMPGQNGMAVARKLRRTNRNLLLIFVTGLSEYVYEAFDVNAFHYLLKPFREEKLRDVLEQALKILADRQGGASPLDGKTTSGSPEEGAQGLSRAPFILVKRGGVSTRALLADIIYAEVFNRKVTLHTTKGDLEYYGKLSDLAAQAGAGFFRTHRAYLVNLNYVEKYDAATVWLTEGKALLSKKQFAGFVQTYLQYISRGAVKMCGALERNFS